MYHMFFYCLAEPMVAVRYTVKRSVVARNALPKKAPATAFIIKPFTEVVSISRLPMDANSKENVAFTAIELTIIDKKAISGSRTARKKEVNNATSSSSNISLVYYVFGWA